MSLFDQCLCFGVFQGILNTASALWAQNWCFSESDTHYERKSSLQLCMDFQNFFEHDIIKHTQISSTSLTNLTINSRTNRGTSEGSETSEQEYLTRRILFFGFKFVGALFSHVLKNKRPKKYYTKLNQKYLDSSCRELSNGGLGIVVVLW